MCSVTWLWILVLDLWVWSNAYSLRKYYVRTGEKNGLVGIIENINKVFDHRIRLGIMSILMVNEDADFNRLKELLEVTDGNLASHLKALEKKEYILVNKSFIGRKPNTRYSAIKEGKVQFRKHHVFYRFARSCCH